MNAAVVYFSRTGNTQKLAQAIATEAKAPIYELSQADPSKIASVDLLIFGTPVEGCKPHQRSHGIHRQHACSYRQKSNPVLLLTEYLETNEQ